MLLQLKQWQAVMYLIERTFVMVKEHLGQKNTTEGARTASEPSKSFSYT